MDVLARALELVDQGWTRSAPARDRMLQRVNVMDESAVYFCAQGAIIRAARELHPTGWGEPLARALKAYADQIGMASIPYWQDREERTIGEIKECFRRAIYMSTPMKEKV